MPRSPIAKRTRRSRWSRSDATGRASKRRSPSSATIAPRSTRSERRGSRRPALSPRPEGRRQLDPPEGAALVHRPLRPHEAGSLPAEDPDGRVVRLLAEKRRDQAHEAAELDLDVEANRLVRSTTGGECV